VAKADEILSAKASDIGEWIELAVALLKRGDFHAALETYDTAMQRFPESHMLWCNRGVVLLYWERYDEALEHFAEALRIKPNYIFALANMASTYECTHEFGKAAEAFQRLVELEPESAKAWNSLGLSSILWVQHCLRWGTAPPRDPAQRTGTSGAYGYLQLLYADFDGALPKASRIGC